MRSENTVIKADFDKAIKQPWGLDTCIIAQFYKRTGRNTDLASSICRISKKGGKIQEIFDTNHTVSDHFRTATKESKRELKKLRASLPIKVFTGKESGLEYWTKRGDYESD